MKHESGDLAGRGWAGIEARLGGSAAIDALARQTGAIVRRREVRDGSQLLRLALNYASSGGSLRSSAAWGEAALGVALSDVALMERLQDAGDFLAAICAKLLARAAGGPDEGPGWQGPPVRLVDASVFAGPGAQGGQHRLHASYDPCSGRFTSIEVTAIAQGESLSRAGVEAGSIAVADRGYARTAPLRQLGGGGAFFAVRAGIRSMRMLSPGNGKRIEAADALAALDGRQEAEIAVELIEAKRRKADPVLAPVKARLLVFPAAPAQAKREKARIERSRTRHGAKPAPGTASLASVMMIATNLPAADWPPARVAALYRLRWQIELAFKTLKSAFRMRAVPAKEPRLARAWILANLAAALLADAAVRAMERAIPPSRPPSGGKTRASAIKAPAPPHRKARHP